MVDVGQVVLPCIKRENIIVIGSELHYDSFWFKMMFIAPGFSLALGQKTPPSWRPADKTTVLYVSKGYVKSELLAIEYLKTKGCTVKAIKSISDFKDAINTREKDKDGKEYKIQNLVFFAHGLANVICLNYPLTNMDVGLDTITSLEKSAFTPSGRIYSYACRTGISVDDTGFGFSSLSAAKPENSLAQKMADHFDVKVHAFYKRTFFRYTLRAPSDSVRIADILKTEREKHEGEIIQIPSEHEALPHDGLDDNGWDLWGTWFDKGAVAEGVDNYALWRKAGARALPIVADTPKGLPDDMHVFEPKEKQ